MGLVLRHKQFPLVIAYRDPKKNWDDIVEKRLIKEIKENGFDNFVLAVDKEEKPEESSSDT